MKEQPAYPTKQTSRSWGEADAGGAAGGTAGGLDQGGRLCASQPRRILSRVPNLTLLGADRRRRVLPRRNGGEDGVVSCENCQAEAELTGEWVRHARMLGAGPFELRRQL